MARKCRRWIRRRPVAICAGCGAAVNNPAQPCSLLPGPDRVEGVPDFTCSVAPHGRTVHLECKAGTGRQSEAQKTFQRTAVLVGARYLVIRSVDDVARALMPANDNQSGTRPS